MFFMYCLHAITESVVGSCRRHVDSESAAGSRSSVRRLLRLHHQQQRSVARPTYIDDPGDPTTTPIDNNITSFH